MRIISIYIGKVLIFALRLFGRGGSALPGLVVEKLYPKLIEKQLANLPKGVVIVTGTNGKTTTTKALVYLLEQCGLKVVTNPTGSNFTRGVYATLARYSRLTGSLPYDVAVFELDEAFSAKFAEIYRPDYLLVLNVMRDQLDRYGEIDKTAEYIVETVANTKSAVVLNADDERIARMKKHAGKKAKVKYFSVSHKLRGDLPSDDELHAKKKHHKTKYGDVVLEHYHQGTAVFGINDKKYSSELKVPGLHNAVNIAAALAAAMQVYPRMEPQFLVPTLANIESAFGRGETIEVEGKRLTLSLVKNPSGFKQAMRSFADEKFDSTLFAINDQYADGRDVSWLWDVDFEDISKEQNVLATGTRGYDIALRLSYDGFESIGVDTNIKKAVAELLRTTESKAIIYCTYTAMLEFRKILSSGRGSLGDVW